MLWVIYFSESQRGISQKVCVRVERCHYVASSFGLLLGVRNI